MGAEVTDSRSTGTLGCFVLESGQYSEMVGQVLDVCEPGITVNSYIMTSGISLTE
ncbi:MAG: hypothetical protein HC769_33740 [Cyanobacteria bacterium CRU_2_1]|nr:hypothetical protein [Cyanobacteria bacterium CRU_2_1]